MNKLFSVIANPNDESVAELLGGIQDLQVVEFPGEVAVYSGSGSFEQLKQLEAQEALTVICH